MLLQLLLTVFHIYLYLGFSFQDTDECLSNPCWGGGTCFDSPGSYICRCASGWTRTNCVTVCFYLFAVSYIINARTYMHYFEKCNQTYFNYFFNKRKKQTNTGINSIKIHNACCSIMY